MEATRDSLNISTLIADHVALYYLRG